MCVHVGMCTGVEPMYVCACGRVHMNGDALGGQRHQIP